MGGFNVAVRTALDPSYDDEPKDQNGAEDKGQHVEVAIDKVADTWAKHMNEARPHEEPCSPSDG